MEKEKKFEEFDHSGDVGIEAWGASVAEVMENAARGLFSLMVTGGVEPAVERRLSVRAADPESLLVDWLSEVIAAAATNGEVYTDVEVVETAPGRIDARLRGEPIDEGRHELRFDVKAATYHGLLFAPAGDGYRARVVFDL